MFLNLFRAVTYFKGPQILATHFNENFNKINDCNSTWISIRNHGSKVDFPKNKGSLPQ